jgi:hypothetical protein
MILRRTIAAFALSALMAVPASAALINNQLNQGWASFRDLSSAAFSAKFAELSGAGYRLIDVDAYPNGSGLLYSQVWEKNSDTRAWAEHRDLTSAQYATFGVISATPAFALRISNRIEAVPTSAMRPSG